MGNEDVTSQTSLHDTVSNNLQQRRRAQSGLTSNDQKTSQTIDTEKAKMANLKIGRSSSLQKLNKLDTPKKNQTTTEFIKTQIPQTVTPSLKNSNDVQFSGRSTLLLIQDPQSKNTTPFLGERVHKSNLSTAMKRLASSQVLSELTQEVHEYKIIQTPKFDANVQFVNSLRKAD